MFAMKAMSLADFFNMSAGAQPVGESVKYRAELTAPDGPSTGGGKQAVQHISLIPETGGATIVAGNCNQVDGTAQLRSHAYLEWMHAQRFQGAALPLEKAAYDAFFEKCEKFFATHKLKLTVAQPPPPGIEDEATRILPPKPKRTGATGERSSLPAAPAANANQKLLLGLIAGVALVVVVVLIAVLRAK